MNVAPQARNESRDAKINIVMQLVLFVPALMIFGFTLLNIGTAVLFLVIAFVRLAWPTERMRKLEFNLSLVLLVAWLALTIL